MDPIAGQWDDGSGRGERLPSVIPDKRSKAARRSGTQRVSASGCEHRTSKKNNDAPVARMTSGYRISRWRHAVQHDEARRKNPTTPTIAVPGKRNVTRDRRAKASANENTALAAFRSRLKGRDGGGWGKETEWIPLPGNGMTAVGAESACHFVIPDQSSRAARRSGTQRVSASECEHRTSKKEQ